MFDVFFIFSALFLRTESLGQGFYRAALRTRMHKIAADKMSIMECHLESTSVTINFFQNLTQYIITH